MLPKAADAGWVGRKPKNSLGRRMGLHRAQELLSEALTSIRRAEEALHATLGHLGPRKRGATHKVLARLAGESEAVSELLARVKFTADERKSRIARRRERVASPRHSQAETHGAEHHLPPAVEPDLGPRRRPTPAIDREIVRIARQALNPPLRVPGLQQELRDLFGPDSLK